MSMQNMTSKLNTLPTWQKALVYVGLLLAFAVAVRIVATLVGILMPLITLAIVVLGGIGLYYLLFRGKNKSNR